MGILIRNGEEYTSKPKLDKTLSIEGQAADAKAVGDTKISYTDVVDNLESTATDLPLSANMGNKLSESMGVLLWENSNLTADFAQQNITLPSADYDYLKIFWVSLSGCCHCEEVLKGYSTALSFSYAAGNSPNRSHFLIYRTITRNSDTSFSVTDSILSMSSINAEYTKTTNNSLNKPYKIYGCKFK